MDCLRRMASGVACPNNDTRSHHMSQNASTIVYTLTDEAPLLATASFLPIVRTLLHPAGVDITTADISVAGRILAQFPEYLTEEQRVPTPGRTGQADPAPEANIIKLPNISASVSQLVAAIKELQAKGYKIPDYPENPKNDEEKPSSARYNKCIGFGREPGAARRQLRPPCAARRQGICPQEPAQHGRVEPGLAFARLAHARRRLLPR
jgi:monomeric type NADP-dependent isocitrate dehydrogenase